MIKAQLIVLTSLMFFIPCAQAYIDPGSGSFMLQMFIASLIGGSLTIKMYFRTLKEKLKNIFCRKTHSSQENNEVDQNKL